MYLVTLRISWTVVPQCQEGEQYYQRWHNNLLAHMSGPESIQSNHQSKLCNSVHLSNCNVQIKLLYVSVHQTTIYGADQWTTSENSTISRRETQNETNNSNNCWFHLTIWFTGVIKRTRRLSIVSLTIPQYTQIDERLHLIIFRTMSLTKKYSYIF